MPALNVCLLSSEIVPYAKTGGLADVTGALVQEVRRLGHDVHGFMPLYSAVRREHPELKVVSGVDQIPLIIGSMRYQFSLQTGKFPGTDVDMYFI